MQLPGREERFGEPPREDAAAIATDIAAAIEAEGWEAVTLLGYSYGALLAFETACALEASARCRVSGLVACARAAPQTAPLETVADGPDADLLAHVRRLGGLPPEIDAAPEFLELLLPVLRADFRANDRYAAAPDRRIAAPIATVAGTDDPATAAGRDRAWADRTHGPHRLFRVAGGHFFVNGPTGATAGFQAIAAAIAHVAGQSPAADAKGRQ